MMSESKRVKELKLDIPLDLYSKLERLAREAGYSNVSEYILSTLVNIISSTTSQLPEDLAKWRSRFERYIQDEVNKRLSIIDTLRSQVAELYERLDSIQQKITELDSEIREIRMRGVEVAEEAGEHPGTRKPYKTGIERLREEKVVFESKLPLRVQRDRLFAYFEREGAVVLKLAKERVAVDPDYWRDFKQKLLSLSSIVEEEIKKQLGDKGFELWKTLYTNNAIIYDSRARKWKFVLDGVP